MALMIDTHWPARDASPAPGHEPEPIFRLEGEFRELAPLSVFADGLRFMSTCDARVVESAPRLSGTRDGRVSIDVIGFVMPPAEAVAAAGFDFPDLDYCLTGSAHVRSADPQHAQLGQTVVSIKGWVNFESGELEVEARSL